ncbi:helix-turn-helix domain-containing protein [Niabella ginsenosidivorans]|nr:helix-turn-helix transcriptional regulator [Niabella ginsenosidivorans]
MKEKLGIMRNTWSNWENGKTEPDIVTIFRIADFFDLDVGKLLATDLSEEMEINGNIVTEQRPKYATVKPCKDCAQRDEIIAAQRQTIDALQKQADALQLAMEIISRKLPKKSP